MKAYAMEHSADEAADLRNMRREFTSERCNKLKLQLTNLVGLLVLKVV